MTTYLPKNFEFDFDCFDDFVAFLKNEPWFLHSTLIQEWVDDVVKCGFEEPVTKTRYVTEDIASETTNFREGIVAGDLNSRQRAMFHAINVLNPRADGLANCSIYGLEQVTAFADRFRSICPSFVGSEYLPSVADRSANPHLRHEDLLNLSFSNETFDIVFSNDVLEHVPDVDCALQEVCRVLKPKGVFVSTFPFAYGQYDSIVKASLEGSEIIFHTEPEYHGNPVDPNGSLVFEIPGWDILDRAQKAGFQRSYVRATASKRFGYIGAGSPAILIHVFEK